MSLEVITRVMLYLKLGIGEYQTLIIKAAIGIENWRPEVDTDTFNIKTHFVNSRLILIFNNDE